MNKHLKYLILSYEIILNGKVDPFLLLDCLLDYRKLFGEYVHDFMSHSKLDNFNECVISQAGVDVDYPYTQNQINEMFILCMIREVSNQSIQDIELSYLEAEDDYDEAMKDLNF